jgi:hypothetical protein
MGHYREKNKRSEREHLGRKVYNEAGRVEFLGEAPGPG